MRKVLAVLAVVGSVAAFAVQAAGAGTTQVSGKQIWTSIPGYSTMEGSLVGDWYDTTTTFDVRFRPSGVIQARGTELFVGCLNVTICGTLTLEYHAEIRLNALGELVRGRCWHRVTGGTEDFQGASGVINFKDDPVNGCSTYSGHITVR